MAITLREGFQVFNAGSSVEYLAIESARIEEYMVYFEEKNFTRLFISSFHGYNKKDLSFLINYPFIQGIYVYSNEIDLHGLQALKDLKFLLLAGAHKSLIDFSWFTSLSEAHFSCKNSILNLASCHVLKELHLRDYNEGSNILLDLPELKHLELIQSGIESLKIARKFGRLEKLELHNLNRLTTLGGIEAVADSLLHLSINGCKKITDHHRVSDLKKLKELAINNCGEVHSIYFLETMPSLHTFRFVNTTIKDGNLAPCLRLRKVRFSYKKHYTHTPDQLEKS
jgi:hypothetical protein